MNIQVAIDIEEEIRSALADYFNVYVRPLPASYTLPNLLIQQVGGAEENTISTFEVTIDSRAEEEAEALEQLNKAIGTLEQIAKEQTTAIRHVTINAYGSWGTDPIRPDLAMCSARLRVVAHKQNKSISKK